MPTTAFSQVQQIPQSPSATLPAQPISFRWQAPEPGGAKGAEGGTAGAPSQAVVIPAPPSVDLSEEERRQLEQRLGGLDDQRVIPRAWLNQPSQEFNDQANNPSSLTLADVLASVYRAYPSLQAARLEQQVATGQLVTSWGEFDLKLNAYTVNQPLAYYENYRHGLYAARNTWWGGYVGAGYRIGRGDFEPWYKERETFKGGEFKLALVQPLLAGRAIDARRVAIFQNQLTQQMVGPIIQGQLLQASRSAGEAYWSWLAAGRSLLAQEILLELAEKRVDQIEELIKAQRKAEVDRQLNEVLIADRKSKVYAAQQKLQETAIKLSLYLRDEQGLPQLPVSEWLPTSFPPTRDLSTIDIQQQISEALQRRPELVELQLQRESVNWDRRLAINQTMPQVDFISEASQDVGVSPSTLPDKAPLELDVGVEASYMPQLRKARGKIQSTTGKISQISFKQRLQSDQIALEVQAAINALRQTQKQIDELSRIVQTQTELLRLQEVQFNLGRIDLIELNVQEEKITGLQKDLIKAQQEWFTALVQLQVATALDPLEQSIILENLPESKGDAASGNVDRSQSELPPPAKEAPQ